MPTVVAKDVILGEQRVQQLTVSNPVPCLSKNGDTGQMRNWVYQHATCAARESIAGKGHRNIPLETLARTKTQSRPTEMDTTTVAANMLY